MRGSDPRPHLELGRRPGAGRRELRRWRNYGGGGGAGVQEEAARGCELAEELGGAPRPYLWAAKAVEGGESGATAGEAALSGVNGVGAARFTPVMRRHGAERHWRGVNGEWW